LTSTACRPARRSNAPTVRKHIAAYADDGPDIELDLMSMLDLIL
jgi:hypothetical protein